MVKKTRTDSKLPHPFSYYYKSISEGKCPLCRSDDIKDSRNGEVIWCDGYLNGGYVAEAACEAYAADSLNHEEGHCRTCASAGYVNRHYPNDLVIVCEDCRKAINFDKQQVSEILF